MKFKEISVMSQSPEKSAEKSSPDLQREDAKVGKINTPEDDPKASASREIGGPKGPEPTRFGDWEKGGRCIDF